MIEPTLHLPGSFKLPGRSLKPSWRVYRFDQIAINVNDRIEPGDTDAEYYIGLEHLDSDSLKIRRWGQPSEVEATKLRFCKGDIIFGRRRAYQRKLGVAEFDGICSAHAMVLRPKTEVVLPEFLPFFMQSDLFMNRALEISVGSLSPTINWRTLAEQEFALPPLAEQRRLAEVLWAIEDLSNSYNGATICTENIVLSHLEAFLSNYEFDTYVYQVAELLREDPRNGYSPKTNDSKRGLRTVSISAISGGQLIPEGNIKYADVDKDRVSPFFVQENDVFVVRGNGNRYLTGKCGIAQRTYSDLFYPDLLIRLRFNDSQIHPRFATTLWNTPTIHRSLITRAKSTNGIWKINGTDIRQHTLVVPPLIEQITLLAEIDKIKAASGNLHRQSSNLAEIKNHLLNHHIRGDL